MERRGWPEPPGRSPLHSRMASVKPVGETGREQRGKGGNGRRGWRGILHAFGGEVPRPKARDGRSEFGLGSADPPEGSEFRDAKVEGKRGKNRCPVHRLAAVTAAHAAGARRTAGGAESSLRSRSRPSGSPLDVACPSDTEPASYPQEALPRLQPLGKEPGAGRRASQVPRASAAPGTSQREGRSPPAGLRCWC